MSNSVIPKKPMLAAAISPSDLKNYPYIAQPKIDGIRCHVSHSTPYTRSLKLVPNTCIQNLSTQWPHGVDGELMVGDSFQDTTSFVMSHDKEIPDNFVYWVFDICDNSMEASKRISSLDSLKYRAHMKKVPSEVVNNKDELLDYIERHQNYEGVILRRSDTKYKHGRSTTKQEQLLKIKPFEDAEALIIDFEPLYRNFNESTKNELGRTQRSTKKKGLVADDLLGAFVCQWGDHTFKIGTGLNEEQRHEFWGTRKQLLGNYAKFKYQAFGTIDVPRTPVFLGFRHPYDMSE